MRLCMTRIFRDELSKVRRKKEEMSRVKETWESSEKIY